MMVGKARNIKISVLTWQQMITITLRIFGDSNSMVLLVANNWSMPVYGIYNSTNRTNVCNHLVQPSCCKRNDISWPKIMLHFLRKLRFFLPRPAHRPVAGLSGWHFLGLSLTQMYHCGNMSSLVCFEYFQDKCVIQISPYMVAKGVKSLYDKNPPALSWMPTRPQRC